MASKTFFHSGKLGDLCFSLPCIKALSNQAIVYLPERTHECDSLYSSMRTLLESQSYIKEVIQAPDVTDYHQCPVKVDYDLDEARHQPLKGKTHIVKRYLDTFGITLDNWQYPWLEMPVSEGDYTLINWTGRHLNNKTGKGYVDWWRTLQTVEGDKMFIGTVAEYSQFCSKFGLFLPHLRVDNIHALALYIAECKQIYCNQSLVLALSQALGKNYYLEVKHNKTNCLIYTKNEHVL